MNTALAIACFLDFDPLKVSATIQPDNFLVALKTGGPWAIYISGK